MYTVVPIGLRTLSPSRHLLFTAVVATTTTTAATTTPQARLGHRRFFSTYPKNMTNQYKLKSVPSLTLAPGEKHEAEVEGIEGASVLLVNIQGKIQAVGSKCTHYGAPLAKGVLSSSGRLTCPWHGACFNAKTGDVEDAPALDAIPVFEVSERDNAVYVCGDEAAIKSSRRAPNFKCSVDHASAAEGVVVVGGGSGTLGVVEGLREDGYKGPLTVISKEGHYPIDRTKLSKALLTDLAKLTWRDEAWYRSGGVEWVDDEVVGVDFAGKSVTTKKGAKHPYKKLVLATGGTPRQLPLQGFKDLGNIFTLRTVHDVKKIVGVIGDKGKKIVIIGSSFIGMEVANATCKDNSVTVVGMERTPLERVLGDKVGDGIRKALEANGVKFYMSASVEKAEASASSPSNVGAVSLKDGTRLEADLVILGVGVAPATEYLRENAVLGLEKDGSIKTDENFAVAGLEHVYAIGDIATYPYHGPGGQGQPLRIEHWNVAQNAGRVAARHMASPSSPSSMAVEAERAFIPTFWSALHSQLRYCGSGMAGGGWDDVVVDGDVAAAKFSAWYFRGDDVVAVASMGRDPLVMKAASLMRLGVMPRRQEIEAAGYEL